MFIYFFLLIVSYILSFTTKKYKNISFSFLCVVLFFVGFFRSQSVGSDNVVYSFNFQVCSMNPLSWSAGTEMEPGFSWFMAFFKTYICNVYETFMGVEFLLFMAGTIFLIKKYSSNYCLSLFFLILLLYYTVSFNMMRQSCAISLSFFLLPLVLNPNKKNILFYILGILFVTFYIHRSLIIMLLLPICLYSNVRKLFISKKYTYVVLISSFVILLSTQVFFSYTTEVGNLFSFLGDRYVGYIQSASDVDADGRETLSYLNAIVKTGLAIFVVFVSPSEILKSPFYVCFILGAFLSNTLAGFNATFYRLAINYMVYGIIFFPILWNSISRRYSFCYKFVVVFLNLLFFVHAMMNNYDEVVPYVIRIFN
jgi:hypothetical protein